MNYILFDDPAIKNALLPLTFTRPVSHIRVGILTIADKWAHYYKAAPAGYSTEKYLEPKYPSFSGDAIRINGAVCPTPTLLQAISSLKPGQALQQENTIIAYNGSAYDQAIPYNEALTVIKNTWDIFSNNGAQIRADFTLITAGRKSQEIHDPYTKVYHPENVFVEDGVQVKAAIINAENGPVYLGRHSQVLEGAIIRGPLALCDEAIINMGAKLRGDNTIGPCSKVGGEVSNSVIFGYSNKSHDGFIGNTVIGEWCNLGADTNTSNMKNNYGNVQVYNYAAQGFVNTGRQFCGLVMGDHSKTGINTMFNTGTVVGVSANIYGGGFLPKFIPSFSWGDNEKTVPYQLEKALKTAEVVMSRRKIGFEQADAQILEHIYKDTFPEQ
ncbi:GlmU family protein [Cytophagaceae bacterium ABcell3]|nr:GlmU family protein [Cytophagaceae bacterium ABcell3]